MVSACLGLVTAIISFLLPGRGSPRPSSAEQSLEIEVLSVEEAELASAGVMLDGDEVAVEEGASD